jgi:hypothetical protein
MEFTKIAVRADASAARVIQFAQWHECDEVYVVGESPALVAKVREAGLIAHQVQSKSEVPPGVFTYIVRDGTWASVETSTGLVVDVTRATDSWAAFVHLLGRYAPGYQERFHVQPAANVDLIDEF